MKTIIIFDQVGYEDIKFLVVDGDHRHLNNVYINGNIPEIELDSLSQSEREEKEDEYAAKVEELEELLYDGYEYDKFKANVLESKDFPYGFIDGNKNPVIVVGFFP